MSDLSPASGPVCVTGATGYISSYVVKMLLERGYTVRGTTRSSTPEKVQHLTSLPGASERLTLFEADLLAEGSFEEAIRGCVGVYHMASPFFLAGQTEEALVPPALDGTRNVLGSCLKLGVKKVVLTSSTAAVYVKYGDCTPETVYTEDDWSNEEGMRSHGFWYALSKQLAEQAAWKMVKGTPMKLATMNPCLVVGPMLQPSLNTSCAAVLAYMTGSKTEVEATPKAIVDVRDVALAHILGMESGTYEGRTLLIGASFPWGDAQPWLAEAVPACAPNFPIAKQDPASLPAPANWAMASPGTHTLYDCSKAEALGVKFTSAEDSIKATAVDLAKWGHFEAAEAAMPAEGGKPRLDDHREVKVGEAKGCLAKLIVSHNDAVK
jgi:nucleoside-diphosphate-sugar epimerase